MGKTGNDIEPLIKKSETKGYSSAKKEQIEINNYFYVKKSEFLFTKKYYKDYVEKNNKKLAIIDDKIVTGSNLYSQYKTQIKNKKEEEHLSNLISDNNSSLKFELNQNDNKLINLKPFQSYHEIDYQNFYIINLGNQITALDWLPIKSDNENETSKPTQIIAVSAFADHQNYTLNCSLYNEPNLIHFFKLDSFETVKMFTIMHRRIGKISCLKWRPDCGASSSETFLGYLLATSSNGDSYIFHINNEKDTFQLNVSSNYNSSVIKESKRSVILRTVYSFGQCTCADWSQLNGSTQIAIGYTNGWVAVYELSDDYLSEQFKVNSNSINKNGDLIIYPIRTFRAHGNFVKAIKWMKLNPFLLITGSLICRETKVWNIKQPQMEINKYEIFITDLDTSLHSNDIFMSKEVNLK
jgi:hypothetical protein